MNRAIDEILNELEEHEGPSSNIDLLSLGPWTEEIDFVESEQELKAAFYELSNFLKAKLNSPVYEGLAEESIRPNLEPKFYFENFESASLCAWWAMKNYEIMLMVTEHDAGTLQFLRVSISRILIE